MNGIDFEQELYNHFGQVKDFTLGMRIGKYFYELGCTRTAEQFEKNRLAACDNMSKEEYDRETDFVDSIIKNEHRQPTFSDAINYGMRLQKEEESVPPNDLEEAAKNIARDVCKQLPNGEEKDGIVYYAILAAIAGAKWHKEQNDKDLSEKIAAAYQLGLTDKEKQMTSKAVETELYWDGDFLAIDLNMTTLGYSERDKVRVIVLPKED